MTAAGAGARSPSRRSAGAICLAGLQHLRAHFLRRDRHRSDRRRSRSRDRGGARLARVVACSGLTRLPQTTSANASATATTRTQATKKNGCACRRLRLTRGPRLARSWRETWVLLRRIRARPSSCYLKAHYLVHASSVPSSSCSAGCAASPALQGASAVCALAVSLRRPSPFAPAERPPRRRRHASLACRHGTCPAAVAAA